MRLITFLMVLWWSAIAFSNELIAFHVKRTTSETILQFKFNQQVEYHCFTLKNPDRLVVDLVATQTKLDIDKLMQKRSLITKVRTSTSPSKRLRMVFDLSEPALEQCQKSKRQLTIALSPNKPKTLEKEKVAKKQANPSPSVKHSPIQKLRDVVVVIDPGHGGKDPGAIGSRRHLEKNVVLAIALQLKKIIDRQPGMKAVLTRHGDYYIGLRKRLDIARKYDADVFISIHADAFINKKSRGASVFALSQTGATSEAARWLAEKENYSELGGVDLSEIDDENGFVRSVLIDLSQTATIGAGLQMGDWVLKNIGKMTYLHNDAVEQARFVVLKSPDIPSILVETGFISNPQEERKLTSSRYQQQLASAIFSGLEQYFRERPPHGTYVESRLQSKQHVVRRGESLSQIARQYHLSVAALKKHNHLSQSTIYVGQKLVIPSAS